MGICRNDKGKLIFDGGKLTYVFSSTSQFVRKTSKGVPVTRVVFDSSLDAIPSNLLKDRIEIHEIVFLKPIKVIPKCCFQSCGITSVNLLEGTQIIETKAFFDCMQLQEIVLPDTIDEIKTKAFYNCSALKRVVIKSSKLKLGKECFSCQGNKKVLLEK